MTKAARTLGLVAPSGLLPDVTVVDRAAGFFSTRGWRVAAGDSVFAREQRFAGPDDLRLADLERFTTDPTVDLVLCARGGYGLSRLLDRIDFAAIRSRAPVVDSDFTAFNLGYLAAGGISFAGPSAGDFGATAPDAFMIEHFFGVLEQASYSIELTLDGPATDVSGRLWGGNLAIVVALIGTPYLPRVRGGSSACSTSSRMPASCSGSARSFSGTSSPSPRCQTTTASGSTASSRACARSPAYRSSADCHSGTRPAN
jgi:muramoyltetrapeptide carboxypeptidase